MARSLRTEVVVSLCEYGGAQQQRKRSVPPVARIWCQAPGGIRIASPGPDGRELAVELHLARALLDVVELLGDAVVVALRLLARLERRLGEALVLRVEELADRGAVGRRERRAVTVAVARPSFERGLQRVVRDRAGRGSARCPRRAARVRPRAARRRRPGPARRRSRRAGRRPRRARRRVGPLGSASTFTGTPTASTTAAT